MNFCTGCNQDFTSMDAFDRHRVGSFSPNTRRCMSKQEMLKRGLVQKPSGKWSLVFSEDTLARLNALKRSA